MKKVIILVFVIAVSSVLGVWLFRENITRYTVEYFMRKDLPGNIGADRIVIDLSRGEIDIFSLLVTETVLPEEKYILGAERVTIKFGRRQRNLLSGFSVEEIKCYGLSVHVKRFDDGNFNFEKFSVASPGEDRDDMPAVEIIGTPDMIPEASGGTGVSTNVNMIYVAEPFPVSVENGKLFFVDHFVGREPFSVSLENINAFVNLRLDGKGEVSRLETEGTALVDGNAREAVEWKTSVDLRAKDIRMSNRIKPSNVDIMRFEPYYIDYSPVIMTGGTVSGTIIFDMHAGNIGSDNTLIFRDLEILEREEGRIDMFWDASVSQIVEYLESSPGEVVFDFKVKGPVDNPRFYPGPHVSRAIRVMAVDTVSQFISGLTGSADEDAPDRSPGRDIERAVDVFRQFLDR